MSTQQKNLDDTVDTIEVADRSLQGGQDLASGTFTSDVTVTNTY